jgi:hypothetical protein
MCQALKIFCYLIETESQYQQDWCGGGVREKTGRADLILKGGIKSNE